MKWVLPGSLILALLVGIVALLLRPSWRYMRYEKLHEAAYKGDTTAVVRWLRLGADPDGIADYRAAPALEFTSPIGGAALRGHGKIAEILLDAGANPNVVIPSDLGAISPLYYAAVKGHLEAVRVLVRGGAKPTTVGGHDIPDAARMHGFPQIAAVIDRFQHGDRLERAIPRAKQKTQ